MPRLVLVFAYVAAMVVWWQACGLFFSGGAPAASESGQHIPLQPARFAAAAKAEAAGSPVAWSPTAEASAAASTDAEAAPAGAAAAADVPEWAIGLHKEIALDNPSCPPTRRPFHTLLTGQGTTYNGWQSRIMYFHWRKQRAVDGDCTEMTGFTRLCASEGGLPDPAAPFIPSVFVPSLSPAVLAKYGNFGVLNRPHSVVEFFKRPELVVRVREKYVLVAETDHVLMQPMPNLAQVGGKGGVGTSADMCVGWVREKYVLVAETDHVLMQPMPNLAQVGGKGGVGASADMCERWVREKYVLVAETDHVLMQPMPNLAQVRGKVGVGASADMCVGWKWVRGKNVLIAHA
jgi:hypothetical protein